MNNKESNRKMKNEKIIFKTLKSSQVQKQKHLLDKFGQLENFVIARYFLEFVNSFLLKF